MSITYVIQFDVRPSEIDRFRTLLDEVLDAMRHEPNFRNAALHKDPANPLRFMLYETWADHEDVMNVQLGRPYRDRWHAALDQILAGPRAFSIWEPLRSDGSLSLAVEAEASLETPC